MQFLHEIVDVQEILKEEQSDQVRFEDIEDESDQDDPAADVLSHHKPSHGEASASVDPIMKKPPPPPSTQPPPKPLKPVKPSPHAVAITLSFMYNKTIKLRPYEPLPSPSAKTNKGRSRLSVAAANQTTTAKKETRSLRTIPRVAPVASAPPRPPAPPTVSGIVEKRRSM